MIRQPESKSALKRKKRHRRRALRIAFLVSIVILVMFAVVMLVAFALQKTGWLPESSSAGSSAPPAATTTPPATTTMTEPATTTATFAGGTTAIGSGQVADSYFDDAAFIGDSRTQGLQLYTGLPNATFYATQGLMVDTFFSKKFVKAGGGKITIPDAMKNQTFKKVYIMLGVNELGWVYEKVFIQKYGEVVDKVKELQPDAKVYVQSILPVTKAKSDGDAIYNNTKISRYNELIEPDVPGKGRDLPACGRRRGPGQRRAAGGQRHRRRPSQSGILLQMAGLSENSHQIGHFIRERRIQAAVPFE